MTRLSLSACRPLLAGCLALGLALAAAAAPLQNLQLGFLIDSSGSIDDHELGRIRQGYADAFARLPVDGSVDVSFMLFSDEAGPLIRRHVRSVADRSFLIDQMLHLPRLHGLTHLGRGLNALWREARNRPLGFDQQLPLFTAINIAADGDTEADELAVQAARDARRNGWMSLSAEAIGAGQGGLALLRSMVFSMQAPPAPFQGVVLPLNSVDIPSPWLTPWVLPVNSADDFGPVIDRKLLGLLQPPVAVPEPGSATLVGIALVCGLLSTRRPRGQRQRAAATACPSSITASA